MSWRNTPERYGALQIALHWAMLALLIAVYACIELKGSFPKGSEMREALKAWHFMLGLSVLIFATVRLVVHLVGSTPRIQPAPPHWQAVAAKLVHFALYLFMIAMPILGWLTLSADGKVVSLFGIELPSLLSANAALADRLEEIHETIGTIGYGLVGLHAAAALAHHYLMRDNTLRRMLPRLTHAR